MSLQNLAHHLQSAGRGDDKMLVHMTPHEVAGLQTLAAAHGGSLTVNPETGLPEAGFLSSLLPTVIGAALAPATGGASLGLSQAWQTAALVGGAYGLATGSLKKGLMAGLGAYGGANLGSGLAAAGAATPTAPVTTPSVAPPAPFSSAPPTTTVGSGMVNTAPDILKSPLTGQPVGQAGMLGAPTPATPGAGGAWPPAPAAAPQSIVAAGGAQGAPSVLSQMGSGAQNLMNDPEKLKAFLGEQKYNLLSSLASSGTNYDEEEKKKATASGIPLDAYHYAPRYAPSARMAGSTAERTYFAADGGLASLGPVESMSQQNAMTDNTRYPMAFQNTSTYASPSERPVSQNVIYPPTDADVTPYSGTLRMAEGGIARLAAGGRAAKGSTSAAKADLANLDKDYKAFVNAKGTESTNVKNEAKKRAGEVKTDYEKRIKDFDAETKKTWPGIQKQLTADKTARLTDFDGTTKRERKERTDAIAAEKDKDAKKQMQADLQAWEGQRKTERAGIAREFDDQLTGKAGYAKERADGLTGLKTEYKKTSDEVLANQKTELDRITKELNDQKKEYGANYNLLKNYAASGVSDLMKDVKGGDLTALTKGYDAEVGVQKGDLAKAEQLLKAAKASGVQSAIDRAQEYYNAEKQEYDDALKAKDEGITQFKESTKRTGELGTRGQYTTTTPAGDASAEVKKTYNPATGQYETPTAETFQKLAKAPAFGTTKKIMEEDDVNSMFEYMAGRRPTESELAKYVGKSLTEAQLSQLVGATAELGAVTKFTDDDLNAQAQYYWGRPMTKGELAWYKDPANRIVNFTQLRNAMTNSAAFLDNVNKVNQAAFQKQQAAAQIANEGPASVDQIGSAYQDILGKPPTYEQLQAARSSGATYSQLVAQLKNSPEYAAKATKPFVPEVTSTATAKAPAVTPISQAQIDAYRAAYNAPAAKTEQGLASLFQPSAVGAGGYTYTPIGQQAAIEGALPYQDVINRLGIGGVYSQLSQKLPEMQPGMQFGLPTNYTPLGIVAPAQGMAMGGETGGEYHLGDYSDGGRLLKGPGDGVSDSIPASINGRRPARLADGEFVIPARIVSEIGNGSTEAGARQLYAMMDRVQKRRSKSMGKDKVAVDSKASQDLPV